jgi:ornithine carbamoyltransferase
VTALETAATRLGARVSVIGQRALAGAADPARLGQMLGSLYDAVDCDALSPDAARELQRLAGVPVFDGLAGDGHPLRALVPALLDTEQALAPDDALSSLLQAALIETMS